MTDKYAVIGNPIAHSKSPQIHKLFAQQTGQNISYEAILAPPYGFAATIKRLRDEGYKGCNVTVPFKEQAFQLSIDGIMIFRSEDVDNARAANTLNFLEGAIEIENTDGVGLVRDLEQNLGISLKGKRLLLMGAGGAARGVILPLRRAGAKITITNRTMDKAHHLANIFSLSSCSYEELAGKQFDVVINATSSGLSDEMPPLPRNDEIPLSPPFSKGEATSHLPIIHSSVNHSSVNPSSVNPSSVNPSSVNPSSVNLSSVNSSSTNPSSVNPPSLHRAAQVPHFEKGGLGGIFAPGALAYDMMYGRETPFIKFAREQGAAVVADGLGMLVEQAAEAFFIWRDVRPETAPVIAALRTQQ